jgi:hypothetical protein
MPKRIKNAVRKGHGTMCNICGVNCGRGGPLKKHLAGAHQIDYDIYKDAFYGKAKTIISDSWDDSVSTHNGRTVITHVLVRRFVGDPGPRGVTRSAKVR